MSFVKCKMFLSLTPLLYITVFGIEVDLDFQKKCEEGENRYSELVQKSYGDCWKEALANLHIGCKDLTEEVQSRLALSFANCFLQYSGSQPCSCLPEMPISKCLSNSSDRLFSTYTEFFTHTQSICHYLQHKEWQRQTEKTVVRLTENSETVSRKLDESIQSQSVMIDMQHLALLEQRRLISNGRLLNAELALSRSQAKNVFEDFKSTTNEQRLMIFEVFDRIKSLQHFVLGEFSSVYTCAYYIVGVFLVYMLTSVPQTANARIWLLCLIALNFVTERVLSSYLMDAEILKLFPLDVNGPLYTKIWICRKAACSIGFMILASFYHRYKDYNSINNRLLREIEQQNLELLQLLKSMKVSDVPIPTVSSDDVVPLTQRNRRLQDTSLSTVGIEKTVENNRIAEKTPKISQNRKITSTPKAQRLLTSKENIEEVASSPLRRYNLRSSRTNSPASSPLTPQRRT